MRKIAIGSISALVLLTGCQAADGAANGIKSAGSAAARGVTGVATSLVNVNLSNVLNNLALDLKIDKSNIPINAQVPISVAANVCGVSINILSIGGGGPSKGCTANTASPELVQAVQQQLAAQGNVGGGAQTGGATAPASGAATRTTTSTGSTTSTGTTTTAPATGVAPNAGATSAAPATQPTAAPTPRP